MVIKTKKGMYQIQKNYRNAFNEEGFVEKYIEECLDKYLYIVGDISSNILRLKGFDTDPKSKNYYGFIGDYLQTSCAIGCPYYVLKRIHTIQEFERLAKDTTNYDYEETVITPIKKENFDKESLILQTSVKDEPNIVLDIQRINAIPKGELTGDLLEFLNQDKGSQASSKQSAPQVEEETQTYVSSSPDFDPSKKINRNHQRNRGNNKNKNRK